MSNPTTCRVCSNANLTFHFEVKNCRLEKCANCGFVQVDKQPSLEELNQVYSENYYSHNKYDDIQTQNRENARRLEILRRHIESKNSKILEVGCATGDFIRYVHRYYKMWGVDISEYSIDMARQKNPEIKNQLYSGPLEKQEFAKEFFDGIVLWDVLAHIWNPEEISTQILNYLKPGGYIFLSTPNAGSLMAGLMGKHWAFMTPPELLGFFTQNSLKHLFEKGSENKIIEWNSRGKWVNLGFLFYKLNRVFPIVIPQWLVNSVRHSIFKNLMMYIPTGDIQYLVIQKVAGKSV